MAKKTESILSLKDACSQNEQLRVITATIDKALENIRKNPDLFEVRFVSNKTDHEFMEYQYVEPVNQRSYETDRIFPLDTVTLQEFRTQTGGVLENAILHTGPAADEFVRSMNALAVTIASDIYFRNNAYHPTDEEGEKILLHELTHVQQHDEKRIHKHTDKKELESEAAETEQYAVYESDPLITVPVGNKSIEIRTSERPKLIRYIADEIENWIIEEKHKRSEQEYLKLLCAYEKWLGEC